MTVTVIIETVFVLDCSGSMQGDSIGQAVAALELCLRSLSPGDTFNICRFGSTFELLANEALPYTQPMLDRALEFVRRGAGLGGTELHAPLEAILRVKPRAGTVRQVVLLTDGQVSNEPAVIDLARRHRGANRIFSFGIGAACSAFLVKGIARAAGGASEFITEGERIDEKVLRTFSRLASPIVGDVSIDWDGTEVQTLAELPPVFDGDVLAVYGRAPGQLPKKVTLSCITPAGPKQWSVPVAPATDDGGVIAAMWARRMLQSIEEVNGVHTLRLRNPKPTREQKMLIDLSKEFGLLCSLTTFIAVEHRSIEERNEGRPELRRVPVAVAKGWHGIVAGIRSRAYAAPAAACAAIDLSDVGSGSGLLDLTRASEDTACAATAPPRDGLEAHEPRLGAIFGHPSPSKSGPSILRRVGAAFVRRKASDPTPAQPVGPYKGVPRTDDLTAILSSQMADGSFDWNGPLPQLVEEASRGACLPVVESALPAQVDDASRQSVIAAILILLLLQIRFADREALWSRASRKTVRSFLSAALRCRWERWMPG